MNSQIKILIVDDEDLIRLNLRALLEDLGYRVVEAANGQEGLDVFNREHPDLVLADLRMPVMDGLSMISTLKETSSETPVIVISGTGTIRNAIDSLRLGAWDYMIKPVEDPDGFGIIIRRSLEKAQLLKENRYYREHLEALVRKRTAALDESETRYRRLLESITSYVYSVSFKDGCFATTIHGPGCEALTGFTPGEYVADPHLWYRMVHTDDQPLVLEMSKRITTENLRLSFEHRLHHKNATLRWVSNTLVPHRSSGGELLSYDGIVVDITERKQAQEELERISNRNRSILESAGEGIFGLDGEGGVAFINAFATKALGYDADELIGKCIHELIHPRKENDAPYPREDCPICKTFATGETWSITNDIFWRKNGTSFPVEYTSTAIMENRIPIGAVVTFRDVTERNWISKQLQQAEKMESIGVLAGGIAHDFNNILSSIFGFTELAKAHLAIGGNIGNYLNEVLQAGLRARDLVKHILLFSRQVDIKRSPVMIVPLIKESLRFLRASVPSTIEIKQNISVSTGVVVADPSEIHQILMNLCTNAAHAMAEKGGILDVRLTTTSLKDGTIQPHWKLKPGNYFQLTITDTGHGIPRELIERIFDPFFTTKQRGEGTGLGLSIVHGIVAKLGGAISVNSEPGRETTFHVMLPQHEEETSKIHPTVVVNRSGKGKILFVDDEESIVFTAKKILEGLGYDVTETTGALSALELFKSGKKRFDLVITDLTMPKMTGVELAKQIFSIRPDIPIILCTGFSAGFSQKTLGKLGIREIIMKPMITTELAEAIDRVLKGGEKKIPHGRNKN